MSIFYQFDPSKSGIYPLLDRIFPSNPGIQDGAQYGGKCSGNFAILRDAMLGEMSILGFFGVTENDEIPTFRTHLVTGSARWRKRVIYTVDRKKIRFIC